MKPSVLNVIPYKAISQGGQWRVVNTENGVVQSSWGGSQKDATQVAKDLNDGLAKQRKRHAFLNRTKETETTQKLRVVK